MTPSGSTAAAEAALTGADTTEQLAESLRASLTSIRRDWRRPDLPSDGGRGRLGCTSPIPSSQLTRMSIQQDIAFWVQAAINEPDGCLDGYGKTVDLGVVPDMCAALLGGIRNLSGWAYAKRMAGELEDDASALHRLTHDEGVLLGPCPVEIPHLGDEKPRPCGRDVRAHLDRPSDVRCPGCGTKDTIEGWQRRMVGNQPVTEHELAQRLIWLGRRVMPATIRQWVSRGIIPPPEGQDEQGRSLYSPEATMRALMARERGEGVAS